MDKAQASRFIQEVFTQGFERERFRQFVHELLNRYDSSKSQPMQVPDAFIQHIKSCQRLGTYQSPGGELLDILIVNVAEDYKIERTRTALRDFVAHKLKRGDNYKEAALVAFVPPSSKNWRFSYVRMEYETTRDPETGKIKPEERLTPARRYSYLVGVDEKSHTAQKQLLPLLADDKQDPELSAIEQAFSVEKVTKEFFSEYSRLFEATDKALNELIKKDKVLRTEFEVKHVDTVAFAKKLLGQIVFLYFIQKKGWLGVPKNGKWGDGPRDFLRHLANKAMQEKKNIFNDVLEPLFYDTLATDRGHEAWCPIFQCRIPFLNGGLFEPLAGYDWENTEINLPNFLLTNQERSSQGDIGTGILDVFDRYNFTVNEAEPLEKEVAIDPEMLGKVFENLIEENRRKGLGAFYTPREIVHYMCQESLINYLDTGLNRLMEKTPSPPFPPPLVGGGRGRGNGEGKIARKDLEEWIHQSDQYAHYASAIEAGMLKGDHYHKPPESIRQYAREIDALLRDILVCDPAIGSGAFPVGMMMEVVRARMALTPYFNDIAERTPYHFKRHAIQSSLYGVDIDVGAVEIAKLRLWLLLVVDEEDVQQIKPLPNLDYKIVVGNSLFGFPFKTQKLSEIELLKQKYFDETDHKKKAVLKDKIDKNLSECIKSSKNSLGFEVNFDFEIFFSEVFHRNAGFDIVIANPPYVRQEGIKEFKPQLKIAFKNFFCGTADLYTYFYKRGIEILKPNSHLCFIAPNKFMRAGYGASTRTLLAREVTPQVVIDFGDLPIFDATTYPSILLVEKRQALEDETTLVATFTNPDQLKTLEKTLSTVGFSMPISELKPDGWILERPEILGLMEKLRRAGKPLGEYVKGRFYYGIKTGLNEAFVVDRPTRDRLIREHKSSAEILKPFLRGRDVKRWRIEPQDLSLIFTRRGVDIKKYPAIYEYLLPFKKQLMPGKPGGRKPGSYEWYEIQDNIAYWQEFRTLKIVYPDIAPQCSFSLDGDGLYPDCTLFLIPEATKWLLAMLNSQAISFFFPNICPQIRGDFMRFKSIYMKQIPIPVVPTDKQKSVEQLVEQILSAKQRDASADVRGLEREIDQLVYGLYGLTKEEIEIVEKGEVQK